MRQTILTFVLVVTLLAVGWVWFRYLRRPPPAAAPPGRGLTAEEEGRLAQYRQLQTLQPDISIIADPLFKALQQPGALTPPTAVPAGRPNPFAPF